MKRSYQGHSKVKLDPNQWNSLFLLFSFQFCLLQMSMVVKTHLDTNIELPNTDYRGFIGIGGV